MRAYDLLYDLYADFDTGRLRDYQRFVDVFPPVDSRVALEHWEAVSEELEKRKDAIATGSPGGRPAAEIGARVTREQAFAALDLYRKYGRTVEALILDVDETLRSAGRTDNEIPRSTLGVLGEFHEAGIPIVICTGQTLENVKGFAIQGFGSSMVHSGRFSIVYEAGTGVFTPGHGRETKRLLYEDLDAEIVEIFGQLRSRVLPDAPASIRKGCHLQGNEFNVTLKPNAETGSADAIDIIEDGLVHLLDLLGTVVAGEEDGGSWARAVYAAADTEIEAVLERRAALPDISSEAVDPESKDLFDVIDVAYYAGDAAEISSAELNKARGVEAAVGVMDLDEPFAAMFGDSKSDLRVMEWLEARNQGIAASPEHASEDVRAHVESTDGLLFHRGRSVDMLRTIDAVYRIAEIVDLDE